MVNSMKKVFIFALLLVGVCGASAQNELTEKGRVGGEDLFICPKEFSYDGKVHLVVPSSSGAYDVYDDDIQIIQTVAAPHAYQEIEFYNMNIVFDDCPYRPVITQTLFNQDDKWEWITQTGNGFKIMQEGNVELCSINVESDELEIWLLNDKVYLVAYTYDDEATATFYEINSGAETGVKYVNKVKGMKASPTILERSTPVTVEFGDDTEAEHEVTVTSASGQVVQRQTVAAGQTSVSLNTSSWGKGMNIVTTKNSNNETVSCKLIVK